MGQATTAVPFAAHRSLASFRSGVIKPGRCPRSRLQGKSSCWNGVTLIRRSGKWQAQISLDSKELHLGNFVQEEHAAQIHDIAALKLRGPDTCTNFPGSLYQEELQQLEEMSVREVVQHCQSCGTGGRQQSSQHRGVSKHPKGKWEAKFKGRFLGLYEHEADAARAYDRAAVRCNGQQARTNFGLADYQDLQDEKLKEAKQLQHTHPVADDLESSSELVIQTWTSSNEFLTEVGMLQHTEFESMSMQPYRTGMQLTEELVSNADHFQMSSPYLQLSFAEMQQAQQAVDPSAHPLAMQRKLSNTNAEYDSTSAAHHTLCSDHLPQMAASFETIAQPSSSIVTRRDTPSSVLGACDALSMDHLVGAALPDQYEQDFDAQLDALLDILDTDGSMMTLEGPTGIVLGL